MTAIRKRLKEAKTNLRGIPNSRFINAWDREYSLSSIQIKEN